MWKRLLGSLTIHFFQITSHSSKDFTSRISNELFESIKNLKTQYQCSVDESDDEDEEDPLHVKEPGLENPEKKNSRRISDLFDILNVTLKRVERLETINGRFQNIIKAVLYFIAGSISLAAILKILLFFVRRKK